MPFRPQWHFGRNGIQHKLIRYAFHKDWPFAFNSAAALVKILQAMARSAPGIGWRQIEKCFREFSKANRNSASRFAALGENHSFSISAMEVTFQYPRRSSKWRYLACARRSSRHLLGSFFMTFSQAAISGEISAPVCGKVPAPIAWLNKKRIISGEFVPAIQLVVYWFKCSCSAIGS